MKIILTKAFLFMAVLASAMQSPLQLVNKAGSLIVSDPEQASTVSKRLISSESGYVKAKAYAVLANVQDRDGQPLEAYKNYSLAIEGLYAADTIDSWLEYVVFRNMAKISFASNEYEIAARLYGKSAEAGYRYVEDWPDTAVKRNRFFVGNLMTFYKGDALYDAGLITEAAEVYKSIDETLIPNKTKIDDLTTFALLRNEYGLNAKAIHSYDSAMTNFRRVVEAAGVSGYYKGPAYHNMALVYKEQGDLEKAVEAFDFALEYKLKGNDKFQLFVSYMDKGEALMELGRNAEAVEAFESALATGASIDYDIKLLKIYLLAEDAAKAAGLNTTTDYRGIYMTKLDGYADHQKELIAAEKKRVFNMSLVEANHKRLLAEMETRQWWENFWNVVAYLLIFGSLAVGACTWYYRFRTAKMMRQRRAV
ncbi:tetratricopeptide repeat protein [Roseivirga pacifica]|uniref:tetratricopeptide repeat protein n=1 Tax=Roseivirga pacifica TaxID=1267423 RepID=UPI00209505C1|nr:tetratricopeptide repeat protein [Roseivirga pacifica]MCO6358181.1 tetratricopeptide repeat protein [Roseivirga pacifica]MCO6366619.1 tetratricopeptide repeat protein [Roseivirga pacifica]MCO6371104.1 tetratricopeptide repeat protein [Roseivirga pacifica]MCO6373912.1 tetratricopeptide repeat protein [Roseivirga pacifica]MCO6380893.1 tetratricopeptide repeat protein [Roseivirga pacifica]